MGRRGRFRGLLTFAVGQGCVRLGSCTAHTQRLDRCCALPRSPSRAHTASLYCNRAFHNIVATTLNPEVTLGLKLKSLQRQRCC